MNLEETFSTLLTYVRYMVLITFAQQDQLFDNLNTVQFTYGLITPSGSLLRALLLALNQSQLLCRNQLFVSYPADITVYGGPISYLILQSLAFYTFLVLHDSGWRPSLVSLARWIYPHNKKEMDCETKNMPPDVDEEAQLSQRSLAELRVHT